MSTAAPSSLRPSPRTGQGSPLRQWHFLVPLVVVAVIVVLVAGGMNHQPAQPPTSARVLARVEAITLKTRPYEEILTLPARIMADTEAAVTTELAGRLERWLVAEGAHVERGQPVAELNTDSLQAHRLELQAQLASAAAGEHAAKEQRAAANASLAQVRRDLDTLRLNLESATSSKALSTKEFERAQNLAAQGVATQSDLDIASNALTQAGLAVQTAQDAIDKHALAVSVSAATLGQAEAGVATAVARIHEIEAAIAALDVTIAKSRLLAPISGDLEEYLVEAGETVAPGDRLAHIYDLAYVRAQVDVADRYVAFLTANAPAVDAYLARALPGAERRLQAVLELPGPPRLTGGEGEGLRLDAEVAYVAQAADPTSNTFRVDLRLPNPGKALRQGVIVRAHLTFLVYREATVVPLRAIQVSDQGPRLLVLRAGSQGAYVAEVRQIDPVSIRDDDVLVRGILAAGDLVIIAGGKGVVHGEEVELVVRDGQYLLNGNGPAAAPPGTSSAPPGTASVAPGTGAAATPGAPPPAASPPAAAIPE